MLLGNRLKKVLAFFILISFIPTTTFAQEEEGVFTRLQLGEPAPFDSWCFDDIATAKIKTALELADEKCQIRIAKAIEQQEARHSLLIGNLEVNLKTTRTRLENIISIKDKEIQNLEAAALKRPNDYTMWWATGGFLAGAATVLAIVFSVK